MERARRRALQRWGVLLLVFLVSGCARKPVVPAAPRAAAEPVAEKGAAIRALSFPSRLETRHWQLHSVAVVRVGDAEHRIVSDARVSWGFDRRPDGGLRGRGAVERFAVRSSLDSMPAVEGVASAVTVEALLDSVTSRVTTRPLMANECDRPEAAGAALARELLVRVPDGVTTSSQWRDSSATIVCRSGVPMTVYSVVETRVESLSDDRIRLARRITQRLVGVGGSVFRGFEISGAGSGAQRLILSVPALTLLSLVGESRLDLRVGERLPGSPVRQQSVTQRVDLRVELVP